MRPEYELIENRAFSSFIAKRVIRENRPFLSQAWHYHPEIEICFTAQSNGKRYVGNNISEYKEGDLVMLGQNLPHGFTTPQKTEQLVIQFNKDFLGKDFLSLPETKAIDKLINRARNGIVFKGIALNDIYSRIEKIIYAVGLNKLIELLNLLQFLSDFTAKEPICDIRYVSNLNTTQLHRMTKMLAYIENNFQKEIEISQISKSLNLTEAGFYKFVKRHTNKKFTAILNEYKIDFATKLLTNNEDMTISEICYKSGYNNLSYFNRKFKEIMHQTPFEFKSKLNPKAVAQ